VFWLLTALASADCGDEVLRGELLCTDEVVGDLLDGPFELDWQYACGTPFPGLWQTGPEDVYTWICPEAGGVTVVLSDMMCDLDLYVLDGSCDPETGCLAGDTRTDLDRVEAFTTCLAPGDLLHVVVEGYGLGVPADDCLLPDAGTYRLSFERDLGVCDALTPLLPVPGEPGARNAFEVLGGTPEVEVHVLLGLAPGTTRVPGCPGLNIGATDIVPLGHSVTHPERNAVVDAWIPRVAEGRTVTLHAVELDTCRVSTPVGLTW
jgi:hypothetical protein